MVTQADSVSEVPPTVPQPTPDITPVGTSRGQKRALGVFALAAVIGIAWLVLPFGIGILLGTLTAFAVEPFYHELLRRWRRSQLASLAVVGVMTTLFAGVFTLGGYLFISRLIKYINELKSWLETSKDWGQSLTAWINKIAKSVPWLQVQSDRLVSTLKGWALGAVSSLSGSLATMAKSTIDASIGASLVALHILLSLFFLVLTMHFVLRHWHSLTHRAETLLPLHPRHSHALFEEFRKVGRNVLMGTILTGMAQGILAWLGYLIAGVPDATFFGALTAVASLVPVVGTVLIWIPIGIFLMATGHPYWGVFELLYGTAVVVGVSDYVIRPFLVGRHGNVPALLMFIALFGGLEAFNIIGLILGPVLMAISIALLRIYERERNQQHGELTQSP